MGFHTFPIERAESLEDPARYRFCSREELLELLDPSPSAVVADLGSGTGFYSADVSPFVDRLYAVDIQPEMHEFHRRRHDYENVRLVTAAIESLPFASDCIDTAFSIMTHHEYADETSIAEVARVMKPDGRLAIVDWSATGRGDDGPPLAERFGPSTVVSQLEAVGFTIETRRERPETFAVAARS